jgi:hypothetical protein
VAGTEADGADGAWIGGGTGLVAQAAKTPVSNSNHRRVVLGDGPSVAFRLALCNGFNLMSHRLGKGTAGIRPDRKRTPAVN